jgi:hypothetical protein
MKNLTAEIVGWDKTCILKQALKNAGFDAGETIGGLWVLVPEDKVQVAVNICRDMGGILHDRGTTSMMDFQDAIRQEKAAKTIRM